MRNAEVTKTLSMHALGDGGVELVVGVETVVMSREQTEHLADVLRMCTTAPASFAAALSYTSHCMAAVS